MAIVAQLLDKIKPSATMAVTRKAAELRQSGQDIIGLGAGEPDFDTPDFIKQAAKQAMDDGQTKYTAVGGTDTLKQAIIAKFKRENNISYNPSEIIVGCGGKHVIYNAFIASIDPDMEVIIPAPYWVSYPDMVLLAGGKPVIVDCPPNQDFKLTPKQLIQHITPKSRWLILNAPSNPSGATYSVDELMALAEVLRQHPKLWILSDDMYEHIVYDGLNFTTLAEVAPDLHMRILTVNGVSKAYAMTGWRIGYAGGPSELIGAMAKIQSQSTSNPCSISQAAAVAALNGDQSFMAQRLKIFSQRRDMLFDRLNAVDGLSCNRPSGAFYMFVSCQNLIGRRRPDGQVIHNDQDYVTWLLEQGGVAAVPGAAFGSANFFRISYATATDTLDQACTRISQATKQLS